LTKGHVALISVVIFVHVTFANCGQVVLTKIVVFTNTV